MANIEPTYGQNFTVPEARENLKDLQYELKHCLGGTDAVVEARQILKDAVVRERLAVAVS